MMRLNRFDNRMKKSLAASSHAFRCHAATLSVLVCALASGDRGAFAQAPANPAENVRVDLFDDDLFALPVDAGLAVEIEAATDKLGSPLFADREAASKRLVAIGASAFAKLREQYRTTPDIEVKMRIEDVVQTAFYNYQVFDGNGFLGVQMRPLPNPRTPKIVLPPGVSGVFVTNIIEDTGAKRAGVKKGDVIVAIGDEALVGKGNSVLNQLSAAIRSYRPGSSIALAVVRDEQELEVNVILGRCPERQARAGSVRGTSDLYRQAALRFPSWWVENFRQPTSQGVRTSSR